MWQDDPRFTGYTMKPYEVELTAKVPKGFIYDENDEFLKKYNRMHRFCPKCGSRYIRRGLVGIPILHTQTYRDRNTAECETCGWKGIVDDLVAGKNIRK